MKTAFVEKNPLYFLVAGDDQTPAVDVERAVRSMFAAARKAGRNPILFGLDNHVTNIARGIADAQGVPVHIDTMEGLFANINGRGLRIDHKRVVTFLTPDYAGSEEFLALLRSTKASNCTLMGWSTFHRTWMVGPGAKDWCDNLCSRRKKSFMHTLNAVTWSDDDFRNYYREKMVKLQKYAITKSKEERNGSNAKCGQKPVRTANPSSAPSIPSIPQLVADVISGPFKSDNAMTNIPAPMAVGAAV